MLSETKIEKCPHCSSENIVKNGFTKARTQRVLCKDCLKSRVLACKSSLPPLTISAIRRCFLERMSLADEFSGCESGISYQLLSGLQTIESLLSFSTRF